MNTAVEYFQSTNDVADRGVRPDPTSSREFQQHVHVFRAVAIMLIIGAHSIPSFGWESRPMIGELIDTLCNQASIFFFFIAGYLFQYLSGRFQYGSYLKQKFKTVLLPYLLVSIPAIIVSVWFIPQEGMWSWFYGLSEWQQIGLFYLTGKHLEPLWFVPTIALFYVAAPLLLAIDRRPVLYWVVPVLILISIDQGRGGAWGPLNKAVYLLPAYLMGMAYSHFREDAERFSRKVWWLLLAVAALAYAALVVGPQDMAGDLQILFKLALCPVMLLAMHWLARLVGSRLDYVAHVSFGIFFIHAYFISAFRLLWTLAGGKQWGGEATTALFPASVALFLVHTLVVLLASVAIIWVVKKIFPKHSRQLIGA